MNTSNPLLAWSLAWLACAFCCSLPVRAVENLSAVFEAAEAADPKLAGTRSNLSATRELRPQAEAAVNRPTVTGTGAINYNYQDITAQFGSGRPKFDGRSWRLSISQPVYRHERRARLDQADRQIRAQELRVDVERQTLVTRVVERYFDVLGAIDNLSFARTEEASLKRQLEQTQQRFDVGLIAVTDVQEAQAGHDLAVAQAIAAENELAQAREALREITGRYHPEIMPLQSEFDLARPDPDNIDAWTDTALQQNLAVAAAQADSEAASLGIAIEESARYPTVNAVGSAGFNKGGGQFGSTEVFSSDVGLEVNVPFYTGGNVSSRTREARYRHEATLNTLEEARRLAHRSVRDAFNSVVSGVSRIQALKQAVVSTQTALEATQAGFDVGTRTTVDVVAAERDVSRARRDYARARYDYIVDSIRLREAAGTLDPVILVDLDRWLAGNGDNPHTPLISQD
jgi:outer membrane protein